MSDPLSLLREYIINKHPVSHDDQSIVIGELRFPRSTVTAYKQDRGRGDPYPLEALYFLVQKPHLAGAAKYRPYGDECKKAGFSRVLLADQKDVLAYLTGKTETSQYLVSVDELASLAIPSAGAADVPSGLAMHLFHSTEYGCSKWFMAVLCRNTNEPSSFAQRALRKRWGRSMLARCPQLTSTTLRSRPPKSSLARNSTADRSLQSMRVSLSGVGCSAFCARSELSVPRAPAGKTPEGRKIAESKDIEATSNAFVRGDAAVTRAIAERERNLNTRQSCLQVTRAPPDPPRVWAPLQEARRVRLVRGEGRGVST
jgi:hypothetical protein